MGINWDLRQQSIIFLIKKPMVKNYPNQLLETVRNEKYHNLLQKMFGVHGLANMELRSKFNKRFRLLLCVIKFFSKYALVILLKELLMLFKKSQVNLTANQTKYGN